MQDEIVHGPFWRWETDGEELTISVTRTTRDVETRSGKSCRLVLDGTVNGESRSIWAWPKALHHRLLDELGRRGSSDFDVGEAIRIRRGEEHASRKNEGWTWRNFEVEFLDRAELNADPRYSIPY